MEFALLIGCVIDMRARGCDAAAWGRRKWLELHVGLRSQDRTETVAHYVIARADPKKLGATKLNKIMWFADLEAYRTLGRSITGQRSYEKRQHGPVPNNIVVSLRKLRAENKIATRNVPISGGRMVTEHVWLEQPDVTGFTAQEVDILNEAINWVCDGHTAASISDLSHDTLWRNAVIGEQIPIGAATIVADEADGSDIDWALAEIDKHAA